MCKTTQVYVVIGRIVEPFFPEYVRLIGMNE